MSGPVSAQDAGDRPAGADPAVDGLEVWAGRKAEVGGFGVTRLLPRRPRRTVGAWCFADHMGPGPVSPGAGMDIGPHPHIGLQTVTWLVHGAVLHRDSLGSEQLIRPGELNLMTAGHGVAHSEETAGIYQGELHGVQLWIAQPAATREGAAQFDHLAELPRVETGSCTATVLIGEYAGARSPARRDTDHSGVELHLSGGPAVLPVPPGYEHALMVLDGALTVGGQGLVPGRLAYLGVGRQEILVEADGPARALLIGGVPFPEPVLMWWNYVARTREEIVAAHRDWSAATPRFGEVASPLPRIDTPGPPWT